MSNIDYLEQANKNLDNAIYWIQWANFVMWCVIVPMSVACAAFMWGSLALDLARRAKER